jgi:NAD(P)-dependent dehydrogenase (short-subunit alcohol dehydrogenase family)
METLPFPVLSSLPPNFRAIVLGASGGVGSAIAGLVEQQPQLGELFTFSRRADGFDLHDEKSVEAAAAAVSGGPVHLIICATGILTTNGVSPEKSLKYLDPDIMLEQFRTNAVGPALIAKHFLPLLDRQQRSIAAFLSARVGSIGDNRLGGWMSYRAAKSALNQIVHTCAIEYRRTHPLAVVVSIHPGTVRTGLSDPYSRGHNTVSAEEAAHAILSSLDKLHQEQSGTFIAYDGSDIPW